MIPRPLLLLVPLLLLTATSVPLRGADPVETLDQALAATESVPGPERGSCTEQAGIERFRDFLEHLDEQSAIDKTTTVYARDAYLDDTLKTVRGNEAIRDYFVKTAQGLDGMVVRFDDLAVSGRNYYFRWTMGTRMKHLARGRNIRTTGVTLVRFDREGKVILHQDYWDSARGVWDHVPGIGAVIRGIRSRL